MDSRPINIGVLAHVDAGKTTLTEHFLYNSGAIRTLGSVDKGSANTDSLSVEKERGISVKASSTSFVWKNRKINLIDTPGHVDFSSEVERALCVIDVAILLISAVEGVQSHTQNIWASLKKLNIPTLIFINKIDRQGADTDAVLLQIKNDLKINTVSIYSTINEGLDTASIQEVFTKNATLQEQHIEQLLALDEQLLEDYLEDKKIKNTSYLDAIKKYTNTQQICPVFCGIAKNNIGVTELLNGILDIYTPNLITENKDLSAYVFKLEHHKTFGAMAHVKVFSGSISSKSVVFNHTQQQETKINQTKIINETKYIDNIPLQAGDIGILTGVVNINAGDVLGNPTHIPQIPQLHVPVLTVQVNSENNADYNALANALQLIDKEDPALQFKWYKAEKELQLLLMGPMQTEILTAILADRFGIKATFTPPKVVYKETITKKAEGYIRYWMPKPCWAILTFLIEPAPLNSGVTYKSIVSQNDISLKYQNEIERTIPKALAQGLLGWEVTDVKITLIKGEDHNIHSRPGDFNLATPMGIMKGLQAGGTHLLEPILNFEINAHEALLGKIASELNTRRALFDTPIFKADTFRLKGSIPVATSMDLGIKLNSITSGKLRLLLSFKEYAVCPKGEGITQPYKGVNPLDEAQWILHRRGAYKADERII